MEIEYSNMSSGWKYLDHLKFVFNNDICKACPYNATESLQHFLLECPTYKNIRDQNFQEIVDHMTVFMPCLDFKELSPL